MQLFLVRHGESKWNKLHLFQSWHRSKLTAKGKRQAKKVAKWIARKCSPDLLLSSDLLRAKETAQLIEKATQLKPIYTKLMRERRLGSIEGKSTRGLKTEQDHYMEAGKGHLPRDAETLASMKKRVRKIIAKILQSKKQCIVIVGHEAINSVVVNSLLHRSLRPVLQTHTQVHWFEIEKGKVKKYKLAVGIN